MANLDPYFARIGFTGATTPSLATLAAIQLRHALTIPFENLNPLLGWPVRLDIASLEQKLVHDGRGGYCFEHNLLLSHALRTLGFDLTWLAARVVLDAQNPNALGGRTHMLLLVTIAGMPYVVDVGFGGLTLTAPLRLAVGVEQPTPHEPCRIVATGAEFTVQASVAGEWRPLYRFGLQEQLLPDYEIANWYLSNYPQSRFVTNLIAARPDLDRRHALLNSAVAVHFLDGRTERRTLRSTDELIDVLRGDFHISLPDTPGLHAALARVTSPTAVP
jgi:N-hydroxyarylamine O-acetyltransferase